MFDPGAGEFVAFLEDPAATFTATQIKEYGLADIWGARGDPAAEKRVREKWQTAERLFPEFVARVWYSRHGSTPPDPRQARGAVGWTDGHLDWRERYAAELEANPYIAGSILSANGDLGQAYRAAGLSRREAQCFGMKLMGMSYERIAEELSIERGSVQYYVKGASIKFKGLTSPYTNVLMDVQGYIPDKEAS